jgi:hypothetical protein
MDDHLRLTPYRCVRSFDSKTQPVHGMPNIWPDGLRYINPLSVASRQILGLDLNVVVSPDARKMKAQSLKEVLKRGI